MTTTQPTDLKGQTAIITGAGSGIGRGVAHELAGAGMRLVVTARREERLKELCEQLPAAVYLAGDICDPQLPQKLLDLALERFGRCDFVFNNAGILETGRVEQIDIKRVCQSVRVNVEAAYRVAYTALMHFRSVGRGDLINMSSIMGTKVRVGGGWYAGTKYAIEALTEGLRMEFAGTDIRIACLEPGLVDTNLQGHGETPATELLGVTHPLSPADVARIIRFMLEQPSHIRIPRIMVLPGEHEV